MRHLTVAVSVALLASSSLAADWTEFRGPDGTGHYSGPPLPLQWGTDTPAAWKTPIVGKGWSSPILLKGRLYLTTAVPQTQGNHTQYSLRALCLDAATGKQLWERELFVEDTKTDPQPHKKNSHASPTPLTDGERIFIHFGHLGTAALDFDGSVAWKTQKFRYDPRHGSGASPILVDDLLFFTCDGNDKQFVVALDKRTGQVRWQTERNHGAKLGFSFATPQLIEHAGKKVIVSPASDFVMGYDPQTGKELWRVRYPKSGWSLITRPVYAHGLVYICTGYVNQHLIAFKPEGTGDITQNIVWQTKRNAANTPTPLIVGDELYMIADNGFMTCFDAKTGKVHWSERLAGNAYSASPIYADGNIFVTSEAGVGQVIAAGKSFREVAGPFDLQEKTFATFVPSDGALYIRTESQLYKFQK
ncbi:MAG: PQQ-like beta-propeller repeat protein [Bacteroidales bacterium]|nr:PQQ-like beta-propeller repeat protein [Bacteroidales bacterium]